jgi:hypothetical protein
MEDVVVSKHLSRRKARAQENKLQALLDQRNGTRLGSQERINIMNRLTNIGVPARANGVKVERRLWGFQWQVVATEKRGH